MTNFIPLRPPGFTPPPQRAEMPDAKQAVLARETAAADALWLGTQEAEALAGWREMLERASEAVADPQAPDLPEGLAGRVTRELQDDMVARLRTAPSEAAADALEARFAALGARETGTALRTERDLRRRRDTSQALDALEGLMGFAEARPEMLADVLASGAQVIAGLSRVLGPQEAQALQASFAGELPERVIEAVLARDPDRARALLDTPGLAAALGERAEPLRQAAETAQAHRQTAASQAARARFETNLQALGEGRAAPLDVAELAGLDEAERMELATRQEAVLRDRETVEQLLRLPPEEAEAQLMLAAEVDEETRAHGSNETEPVDIGSRYRPEKPLPQIDPSRPFGERRKLVEAYAELPVPSPTRQFPGVVDHWAEWSEAVQKTWVTPDYDEYFVLMNLFALEGGLAPDGAAMAGITQRTLNAHLADLGKPVGTTPADLTNEERVEFYKLYFNANMLTREDNAFREMVALEDGELATAVLDAVFRFGPDFGIGQIIQPAINKVLATQPGIAAALAAKDDKYKAGGDATAYRLDVDNRFGTRTLRSLKFIVASDAARMLLLHELAEHRLAFMASDIASKKIRRSWQTDAGEIKPYDRDRTDYLRFGSYAAFDPPAPVPKPVP